MRDRARELADRTALARETSSGRLSGTRMFALASAMRMPSSFTVASAPSSPCVPRAETSVTRMVPSGENVAVAFTARSSSPSAATCTVPSRNDHLAVELRARLPGTIARRRVGVDPPVEDREHALDERLERRSAERARGERRLDRLLRVERGRDLRAPDEPRRALASRKPSL